MMDLFCHAKNYARLQARFPRTERVIVEARKNHKSMLTVQVPRTNAKAPRQPNTGITFTFFSPVTSIKSGPIISFKPVGFLCLVTD